jgi:hypothetical protein
MVGCHFKNTLSTDLRPLAYAPALGYDDFGVF